MFELYIVGAVIFFGGIYVFKFFFFLLGVMLTSIGFIFKAVIMIILAVIFFPITILFAGSLLSSGIIGLILIGSLIGALVNKRASEREYF